MEAAKKRIITRLRKKARLKRTIRGNADLPRVTVFRSAKHIYVQAVDDAQGKTLASFSTATEAAKKSIKGSSGNKDAAAAVGKLFGAELKKNGIEQIVFDRNGYLYHGRVQSLADGIREAGIKF